MFELMFCSLLTILPDYLYRRYAQGKRFGKEITFFSVWYELRWGITGCLMLTVSLITMIFYFHPSAESATLYYRNTGSSTGSRESVCASSATLPTTWTMVDNASDGPASMYVAP